MAQNKTERKTERLPLYKKVTHQLREQCFASAGEMLPSLRQLSQMLDVNHATISRALRDLEAEGLVEIVPRKGVFSISGRGDAAIELVVVVSERSNPLDVALRMSKGLEAACEELSAPQLQLSAARSVISAPFPEVERFVGELKSRGTSGLVCLGLGFFEGELAEQEERFIAQVAQKIPTVVVGDAHPGLGLGSVYGDPREQMREFLEFCHDSGLREFEYLGDLGNNSLQRERRDCFDEFMAACGLGWSWNGFKDQESSPLAAQLRALPRFPQVVVATNVRRALTVALEAQRRGLQLPDELHILCFASLMEHAQPLLPYASVIMLDEAGVGKRAAQMLHNKTSPGATPLIERVPSHFISGPLQGQSLSASSSRPFQTELARV